MVKILKERVIYRGFFDFKEDLIESKDGQKIPFCTLVTKADGVVILAKTTKKTFLLCHEYRPPIQKNILSIPGGRLLLNEDPLHGARRELLEETGYQSSKINLLGSFYPFPSVCDQKVFVFLAEDAQKCSKPSLEPLESIEIKEVDSNELIKLINAQDGIDACLAVAFFYLISSKGGFDL